MSDNTPMKAKRLRDMRPIQCGGPDAAIVGLTRARRQWPFAGKCPASRCVRGVRHRVLPLSTAPHSLEEFIHPGKARQRLADVVAIPDPDVFPDAEVCTG